MSSRKLDLDNMMGTLHHEGPPTAPALPFGAEGGASHRPASAPLGHGFTLCWASEPARPLVEDAYSHLLEEHDDDEEGEDASDDAYLVILDRAERSSSVRDVRPSGVRSAGTGELPPFLVLAAQMVPEVDPIARLRFIHGALSLERTPDPALGPALDRVAALLATPALHGSRQRVAAARSDLLQYALAPGELEEEARNALVGSGALASCRLFGEDHVRARLRVGGDDVPLYLPSTAASALPLLPDLSVLVLVERYSRLEIHETAAHALRLRAVALHGAAESATRAPRG